MTEEIFKYKSANFDKLVKYGFKLNDEIYEYKTDILDGDFNLSVKISKEGAVSTKLYDNASDEEYVLHLMRDSVGEFVGKVKAEYEKALRDISENCFEREVFKSKQSKEIIAYVREKYGDELEFLWEKFTDNAVWRRKDNKKWYGVILTVSRRKLGLDGDEIAEVLDLRILPEKSEKLIDNKYYFAGYHMNKKHWFTVCLDGSVPTGLICEYLDESYALAAKK